MKIMAERLKALRQEKGLSQKAVGQVVHVAQNTIASYENDAKEPSLSVLIALCDFYDVSCDYLLGRTEF